MAASRGFHDATLTGLALMLAAGLTMSATSCRQIDPEITAVRIATSWPATMPIDQLAFELHDDSGNMLGPRELRPQSAGAPLSPGADVVVYLQDAYGGQWLRTVVQGLAGGQVVASGEGRVAVVTALVSDVTVNLDGSVTPPPPDAGPTLDAPRLDAGVEAGPDVAAPDLRPPVDTVVQPDLTPGDRPPPPPLPNGQPCTDKLACASGQCTDGVCCESASCGSCRACNIAGNLGACRAVAAGVMDPRGSCAVQAASTCGTNGKCDGSGGCQRYPAGTVCDSKRCHSSGEGVVKDDYCDDQGVCQNSGTDFCDDYRCNAATITCFTSCTDSTQCAAGRTCRSNRCE